MNSVGQQRIDARLGAQTVLLLAGAGNPDRADQPAVACFLACALSGHTGIYGSEQHSSQRVSSRDHREPVFSGAGRKIEENLGNDPAAFMHIAKA